MDNTKELPIQMGLKDLDGDGAKELMLWNYTGGAHCCDVFYFFKNVSGNKYSYAGELYAGNTCIDDDNVFLYDLHEHFGYFFTCFACGLEEKPDSFSYVYTLPVTYKKGKLQIQPGDESLLKNIKSNLAYIQNLGWDKGPDKDGFDDGRRKEVALNLATYHFSFGKNLAATKKLFDTYYRFADASKVWKAFLEGLNQVKTSNGF
jgi:hypothetical protein